MDIVRKRERIRVVTYGLAFVWRDDGNAGFSFDCDENGVVIEPMNVLAKENYDKCIDGTYDVIPVGLQTYAHTYTQEAIGKCCCGREVYLSHFTNTCDCGRDYNSQGVLLAPREQ